MTKYNMPLRLYLLIMSVMTAFCWLIFGYVIYTVDPQATNVVGHLLFYLSLFLALSGTAAITGFIVRFIFLRHELIINKVKIAFRQSFLFAALLTVALFLLSRNLLTWLNLLVLVISLSALEFFLLSYAQTHSQAALPDDESGQNNPE